MQAFEDLVHGFVSEGDEELAKNLLHELAHVGEEFAIGKVSEVVGRALVKGVDGVVAAAVKLLNELDSVSFGEHYLDALDQEFVDLQEALKAYVPLQAAVEMAKHKFGGNSKEAKDAREKRKAGIDEVKSEVGDVFATVIGAHVHD